jgi:transcriptional regulator with XRE-family HTH domain
MSTVASRSSPPLQVLDEETVEHEAPTVLVNHLRLARQHLQQAAGSMQELARLLFDPDWKEQVDSLARIAGFVEERYAAMALAQRSFLTTEQFQHFSQLLSMRREAAHLSPAELAKRAGLSDKTIRNIQRAVVSPARETVERLLDVPELQLDWKDVLTSAGSPSGGPSAVPNDSEYNCYIPPGYDSVRMVQQLSRTLNGPGGHIELSSSIRIHCRDLLSFEFHTSLDTECPLAGSYAVDIVASVRTRSQPERRFSMFRFKRYDEEKLSQSLARFGWKKLASLSFGGAEQATETMLLVKRGPERTGSG